MGMYTELQGTVIFKSVNIAKAFIADEQWDKIYKVTGLEEIKDFIVYPRSYLIPSGEIFSQSDCVVKFYMELKNYDNTIEKFISILPLIADKWMLESRYEEYNYWELYRNGHDRKYVNGVDDYVEIHYGLNCGEESEVFESFDVFDMSNL